MTKTLFPRGPVCKGGALSRRDVPRGISLTDAPGRSSATGTARPGSGTSANNYAAGGILDPLRANPWASVFSLSAWRNQTQPLAELVGVNGQLPSPSPLRVLNPAALAFYEINQMAGMA